MRKKAAIIGAIIFAVSGAALAVRPQSGHSELQTVRHGSIVESVYGIGTLTAQRSLQIKSGVTTSIKRFYVKEGDAVKTGQRLVDLDGVGEFRAPFSGVVSSLSLKQGETVFSQTSVMTLTDMNDLYLSASIEQQGALKIKAGLPVKISFDGMRNKAFHGRVESVYSSGSDFLARISVQDLPASILPGMTADVAIVLAKKESVLLVPVAALDGDQLDVRRGSNRLTVHVKLGLIDGSVAEVISGDLKEGDQVVVKTRASS
ncbi:MAG: efflux RND transporter periplasmic adaptor subunit [Oligoflexia bacterium]|nr:efflux RND transporter periplasmic adaptor subunit [Oligoflexia bacterium]